MAPSESDILDLLRTIHEHPNKIEARHELKPRLVDPERLENDKELGAAVEEFLQGRVPPPGPPPPQDRLTWANCIDQQRCYPYDIRHPTALDDLVQAVRDGIRGRHHVRAVGSGHSFSDVAPTDGILLDPHGMSQVLPPGPAAAKDLASSASYLFRVESGITIAALNEALWAAGLALANMGAYEGQTLAGAIATGTHGTGITLGPIASSVRSLVLVAGDGTVYQVEPSHGITDRATFDPGPHGVVLKQDDAWFRTVLVSMGCTGLIYSYTLAVEKKYMLRETRSVSTWEELKPQLAHGAASPLVTRPRHFEVDLNPYAVGGQHLAVVTVRDVDAAETASGTRGPWNWLSGMLAACPFAETLLVAFLNELAVLSPYVINSALKTLKDHDYVERSYVVMNIGKVDEARAYALELSLNADDTLVAQVDAIMRVLEDAAKRKRWYMAGPLALRFVAPADAYLAPQEGRATCMVEFDMLDGITHGKDLLESVKREVAKAGSGVRVHWGLDYLDTVTAQEVPEMYAQFPKWKNVYEELNKTGVFDSAFTDRLGITVGWE